MTLVYRQIKGSKLTIEEGDGNIEDLDGRITTLESASGVTLSDTAYDATSWNANTDGATKNALRDKFVLVDAAILAAVSDTVYGAGWNGATTIAPSKNAVYDKIELIDAAKLNISSFASTLETNLENDDWSIGTTEARILTESATQAITIVTDAVGINPSLNFVNDNVAEFLNISHANLSATRNVLFPDASGTVVLDGDLAAYLKLDGSNDPITGAIAISDATAAGAGVGALVLSSGGIHAIGGYFAGAVVTITGTSSLAVSGPATFNSTFTLNTNLDLVNTYGISFGTGAGGVIGGSTSQKFAFWGGTPAAQQVLATGAGKTVDNVITFLQSIGLCRQS